MDDNIVTVLKFLKKVDVDYEEYGENIIGDISYNAIKKLLSDVIYLKEENDKLRNIENKDYSVDVIRENTQLRKENFDLKNSLSWRINYCQELEKDLFENCSNYVIPIQKVKDKIEQYKKMLLSCNRFSDVDRIKAINERILELEELLKGRKQNV